MATSCFPMPKITALLSSLPTTASISAPTMATTAPFGAAMSQASLLNPQTNSLFYLFLYKKILNYFDLVLTGDSMMLITGSPNQTAKIWNVQTRERSYSFNALLSRLRSLSKNTKTQRQSAREGNKEIERERL